MLVNISLFLFAQLRSYSSFCTWKWYTSWWDFHWNQSLFMPDHFTHWLKNKISRTGHVLKSLWSISSPSIIIDSFYLFT